MNNKYESLYIDNQICFPLYAVSKEVTKQYKPFLEPLDLTYTQYIVMMYIWENEEVTLKELGKKLKLDSGTLTPVLKKLEQKNYIKRHRDAADERNLIITITKEGQILKDSALCVPQSMKDASNLTEEELMTLYKILYKMLEKRD